MSELSCPSCAAAVEFNRLSNLVVCPSCQTSIVVDKEAVRLSGKMSTLSVSGGPFFVKGSGKIGKRRFHVLGRVRYGYDQGFWDEWYLGFDDGEFGWVSEDERNFTLEKRMPLNKVPVGYADAEPGTHIKLGKQELHIDEKGVATCEGAEGELPFVIEMGEKVPYLDLSSGKIFATLEYDLDGSVTLFHGRRLNMHRVEMDWSAEEMGVATTGLKTEKAAEGEQRERVVRRTDRTLKLNCYACGGTLSIPEEPPETISCEFCGVVTDLSLEPVQCPQCGINVPMHGGRQAKSLVCPGCKTLVDISQPDKPAILAPLAAAKRPHTTFKLGQTCRFDDVQYDLIGIVRYRQRDEGVSYFWIDYLLFNKEAGYRWLTVENGHFSLNREIDERPKINPKGMVRKSKFQAVGKKWKVFEVCHNGAEIIFVDGELPWVAQIGDRNSFMDAISPPYLLSAEWTKREMEWSISEYKTREEIAEAFKMPVDKFRKPMGVAPCQPYNAGPFRRQSKYVMLLVFVVNLFLMCSGLMVPGKKVGNFTVQPNQYNEEYLIPKTFTIKDRNSICKSTFSSPNVNNSWLYFDVAVIDKDEHSLLDYSADISYYHGYEGGESWSEGSHSDSKLFKLKEPGEYRLLLKGTAGNAETANAAYAKPVTITIEENVLPIRYFIVLMVFSLAWVLLELFRKGRFESMRWADDDDDDD